MTASASASAPISIETFASHFPEEPGYLDYGKVGPMSSVAAAESAAWNEALSSGDVDRLAAIDGQTDRLHAVVGALTGFAPHQISTQPNTSQGIMQTLFGLGGTILLSPREFPSNPLAVERAAAHIGRLTPAWLQTEGDAESTAGHVTPERVQEQLTDDVTAVLVSLVDYRTGYLADLAGLRDVIGDRLLIVDAIQGFGVTEAAYQAADVVAVGGQKWMRSGWGTGFLATSDRALERLTPVFSGITGTDEPWPYTTTPAPSASARAFSVTRADPIAEARFAAALEDVAAVGVAAVQGAIADRVNQVIDLVDEFGIALASPREEHERAGIVVVRPEPEQVSALSTSLANHGVSVTTRTDTVRFSVHAGTTDATLELLQGALTSFASS